MQFDIDSLDNRDPEMIAKYLRVVERFLEPYHRSEVRGAEHVPKGAALYVGNHNGGMWTPDSFLFGAEVFRMHGMDALPFALGHELVLSIPGVRDIVMPLGAIRASQKNGMRLFEAGKKVLVYPGGDVDSMRPYRKRNRIVFDGRKGYIRLALRGGVPIVPVVAAGAHSTWIVLDDLQWLAKALRADRWARIKAWPVTLCLPWGIAVGPLMPYLPFPSRILIELLEPIHFDRSGEDAAADDDYVAECDERVRATMQEALTRLATEREGR